ncbi:MAG: helix-turn-helix transcriptional regulator [Alphaproteobacteria bacterium]
MRANRLLSILILLQLRGRLTAQVLAAEFEVSERTIYRDIDELAATGVPVYADRGPGGGFALLDGYRTRLTGLNADEADTVMLLGLPGPAADLGLAEPAAMARLKLLAALPSSAAAARIGARFHLDPVDWYRRSAPPAHLPEIARAVWNERRLAMRYESWAATVDRVIDPLGLVLKAGAWYLVARRDRAIRTYKVAKVLALRTLDQAFAPPAGFDLAAHWRRELRRFEDGMRREEATLRVSPAAISRLDRLGADAVDAVMRTAPDAAGWRRATIRIESVERAADLLLGFADGIVVETPAALRREIAGRARRVAALYPRNDRRAAG